MSFQVGNDLTGTPTSPNSVTLNSGCTQPVHYYAVELGAAMRVELTNCSIVTNVNLKTLRLSTDLNPTTANTNTISYNTINNLHTWNWGLNACACDQDLTSIYATSIVLELLKTLFQKKCYLYFPIQHKLRLQFKMYLPVQ